MTLAQAIEASREAGVSFEEALREAGPATKPVPCAPWCAYKDDPDYFGDDTGHCLGAELRTPLTIPQHNEDDLPDGEHDYVTLYPIRRPGVPDAIFIGHGEGVGIEMTAPEAREVIEHLQLTLGQIEEAQR